MTEYLRENNKQRKGLLAIAFDARKDDSKVLIEKRGGKKYSSTTNFRYPDEYSGKGCH